MFPDNIPNYLPKKTVFHLNQFLSILTFFSEDKQLSELDLDGLDELEDSEDEAVLEEYRRKRIAELKKLAEKPRFGDVREVSGQDYVQEVNKAGEGIWVVIHLYKHG